LKLEGTADFPYDATTVWSALHDIDILFKVIPGCKSMIPGDEGEYHVTLSLGVAAIKGDYKGKFRITDLEYPHHYALSGEGAGKPGYVTVNVDCRLESNSADTLLRWSCDAEVGGLIAGIGGRVLTGISKHMAKQFFKELIDEMGNHVNSTQIQSAEG
jgi:carbon monoxide dehydrogenase subunit G